MGSLGQAAWGGLRWSALTQILAQLAQYGSFIVLARVLAPAELGTVASAALVVGLATIVNELGLGAALVQRPELKQAHLDACFAANLAIGLALCLLVALLAAPLAAFFANPELTAVLRVLAPTFLLAGLSVLPRALLERNLRFRELGLIEAGAAAANGGVAIALTLAGHGVWSVVAGLWSAALLQFGAYWATAGARPGLRFGRAELAELLRFGLSVLGSRMLGYFNGNVDYMIVGRLMGAGALGVYSLAYKLVTMPMIKVSHVVLRVAYPAFARLQGDDEAFRRHYLTLVSTLAAVSFPLLASLALFAPEAIALVFGERWSAAVLPTRILCLVGACKALVCSIGVVFMSKGRPGLELKLNLYGALKLPLFLLVGVHGGLPGVAWAYLASSLTGMPVQQHFANRLLGIGWGRYLRALVPAGLATAAMTLGLGAWRWLALPTWASLAGALLLAPLLYLPALQALGYDWRGLLGRVSGRTPRQASAAA